MESFIKEYNYLKSIPKIEDISNDRLYKYLLVKNVRGDNKKIDISDTDIESILNTKYGGYPIPGMIYTCLYNIDKLETQPNVNDRAPIIHCYRVDNGVMYGINLNMLPNVARLMYLEMYYKMFEYYFKDIERYTENNIINLNKTFIDKVSELKGVSNFIKVISNISKVNVSFAYRSYKYNSITNIRYIEINDWKYIPFYNPKNAFMKGDNLRKIYNLYNKSKH